MLTTLAITGMKLIQTRGIGRAKLGGIKAGPNGGDQGIPGTIPNVTINILSRYRSCNLVFHLIVEFSRCVDVVFLMFRGAH